MQKDEIYQYEPLWNKWKVKELLGEGSVGKVYKISKTVFEREYFSAVKFITLSPESYNLFDLDTQSAKLSSEEYFRKAIKNIVNEIGLLYKLKGNTNIITYEDYMVKRVENKNIWHVFIKMEYAPSLLDYVKQNEPGEYEVVKIGIDICNALNVCHKNRILHRDIKEDNIFKSELGDYKLGDFSVSRNIIGRNKAKTRVGTEYYVSPEIFQGKPYDESVDIYSLGIVLYKLLNKGRLPFMPKYPGSFEQEDVDNAQIKRLEGSQFSKPLIGSSELLRVVLKACSFKPEDRYRTAEGMKNDLLKISNSMKRSEKSNSSDYDRTKSILIPLFNDSKVKRYRKFKVGISMALCIIVSMIFVASIVFISLISNHDKNIKNMPEKSANSIASSLPKSVANNLPKSVASASPKRTVEKLPKNVLVEPPKNTSEKLSKSSDARYSKNLLSSKFRTNRKYVSREQFWKFKKGNH